MRIGISPAGAGYVPFFYPENRFRRPCQRDRRAVSLPTGSDLLCRRMGFGRTARLRVHLFEQCLCLRVYPALHSQPLPALKTA